MLHLDEEMEKVEDLKRKYGEIACMMHEDVDSNNQRIKGHHKSLNEQREQQQKHIEGWKQLHQRNLDDSNTWRHQLGHWAAHLQEREDAVRFSVFLLSERFVLRLVSVCVNLSS